MAIWRMGWRARKPLNCRDFVLIRTYSRTRKGLAIARALYLRGRCRARVDRHNRRELLIAKQIRSKVLIRKLLRIICRSRAERWPPSQFSHDRHALKQELLLTKHTPTRINFAGQAGTMWYAQIH